MKNQYSGPNQNWRSPTDIPAIEFIDVPQINRADYENNIAYSALLERANLIDRVKSTCYFLINFVPLIVKRLIRYEMIPFDVRNGSKSALIKAGFQNFFRSSGQKLSVHDGHQEYQNFCSLGCLVSEMSQQQFELLEQSARNEFDTLELRREANGPVDRAFDDSRTTVNRLRSEEHTSELQSLTNLVCRLLLEKKKPRPVLTVKLCNSHN